MHETNEAHELHETREAHDTSAARASGATFATAAHPQPAAASPAAEPTDFRPAFSQALALSSVSRRSFFKITATVGALSFLGSVLTPRGLLVSAYADEAGNSQFTIYVLRRDEIPVLAFDVTGGKNIPIPGMEVTLTSLFNGEIVTVITDDAGFAGARIRALSFEHDDSAAASYSCYADVLAIKDGYRQFHNPMAFLESAVPAGSDGSRPNAVEIATQPLEAGKPYLRTVALDGVDIQYSPGTARVGSFNDETHTLQVEVATPKPGTAVEVEVLVNKKTLCSTSVTSGTQEPYLANAEFEGAWLRDIAPGSTMKVKFTPAGGKALSFTPPLAFGESLSVNPNGAAELELYPGADDGQEAQSATIPKWIIDKADKMSLSIPYLGPAQAFSDPEGNWGLSAMLIQVKLLKSVNGKSVMEKVQKKDAHGNPMFDDDDNPIMEPKRVDFKTYKGMMGSKAHKAWEKQVAAFCSQTDAAMDSASNSIIGHSSVTRRIDAQYQMSLMAYGHINDAKPATDTKPATEREWLFEGALQFDLGVGFSWSQAFMAGPFPLFWCADFSAMLRVKLMLGGVVNDGPSNLRWAHQGPNIPLGAVVLIHIDVGLTIGMGVQGVLSVAIRGYGWFRFTLKFSDCGDSPYPHALVQVAAGVQLTVQALIFSKTWNLVTVGPATLADNWDEEDYERQAALAAGGVFTNEMDFTMDDLVTDEALQATTDFEPGDEVPSAETLAEARQNLVAMLTGGLTEAELTAVLAAAGEGEGAEGAGAAGAAGEGAGAARDVQLAEGAASEAPAGAAGTSAEAPAGAQFDAQFAAAVTEALAAFDEAEVAAPYVLKESKRQPMSVGGVPSFRNPYGFGGAGGYNPAFGFQPSVQELMFEGSFSNTRLRVVVGNKTFTGAADASVYMARIATVEVEGPAGKDGPTVPRPRVVIRAWDTKDKFWKDDIVVDFIVDDVPGYDRYDVDFDMDLFWVHDANLIMCFGITSLTKPEGEDEQSFEGYQNNQFVTLVQWPAATEIFGRYARYTTSLQPRLKEGFATFHPRLLAQGTYEINPRVSSCTFGLYYFERNIATGEGSLKTFSETMIMQKRLLGPVELLSAADVGVSDEAFLGGTFDVTSPNRLCIVEDDKKYLQAVVGWSGRETAANLAADAGAGAAGGAGAGLDSAGDLDGAGDLEDGLTSGEGSRLGTSSVHSFMLGEGTVSPRGGFDLPGVSSLVRRTSEDSNQLFVFSRDGIEATEKSIELVVRDPETNELSREVTDGSTTNLRYFTSRDGKWLYAVRVMEGTVPAADEETQRMAAAGAQVFSSVHSVEGGINELGGASLTEDTDVARYQIMESRWISSLGAFHEMYPIAQLDFCPDNIDVVDVSGGRRDFVMTTITDASQSMASIYHVAVPDILGVQLERVVSTSHYAGVGDTVWLDITVRNTGNALITGFTMNVCDKDGEEVASVPFSDLRPYVLQSMDNCKQVVDEETGVVQRDANGQPVTRFVEDIRDTTGVLWPGKERTYRLGFEMRDGYEGYTSFYVTVSNPISKPEYTAAMIAELNEQAGLAEDAMGPLDWLEPDDFMENNSLLQCADPRPRVVGLTLQSTDGVDLEYGRVEANYTEGDEPEPEPTPTPTPTPAPTAGPTGSPTSTPQGGGARTAGTGDVPALAAVAGVAAVAGAAAVGAAAAKAATAEKAEAAATAATAAAAGSRVRAQEADEE